MRYSNNSNLPLSLGVWLSHDTYNHDPRPNHISATSLIKPLKQLILANRVDLDANPVDIVTLLPSRIGSAIHNGVEEAWKQNYKDSLLKLGYPKKVIERIRINPTPDELDDDVIPVYLEQRAEKEIDGFIISGQFDFIGEGRLEDIKTTSVYTYMNKTNDEKYILQGSIYRWLHPDLITHHQMAIQFIFTDWSASRTYENGYPPSRTMEYKLDLMPIPQVEQFIRNKLRLVKQYWDAPEPDIPECDDEALWRKPTVWKYYKNEGAKRATKVFDNKADAEVRMKNEGGIIKVFPGEVVACRYCDGFPLCSQKDRYVRSGELKLGG